MAIDYSGLGYDQYGNAISSLPAQKNNLLTQPQFDINQDWSTINTPMLFNGAITNVKLGGASIGTANIGTLNWNQSSGGTAKFGGTTNGNGLVQVLDNGGGTVVTLDKTGITVNNGSIVIQNSSGSNVLDANGVVSTNNFTVNSTTDTASGTYTTLDTWTDFTGASYTITPSKSVRCITMFSIVWVLNSNDHTSDFQAAGSCAVNIAGVRASQFIAEQDFRNAGVGGGIKRTSSLHVFHTLGTGANVIKAQFNLHQSAGAAPELVSIVNSISTIQLGN